MFTILSPRPLALAGVLAVAMFVPAALPAVAAPAPEPATGTVTDCQVGMDGMAGRLRASGISAQAANVATQLTYRDCLRNIRTH